MAFISGLTSIYTDPFTIKNIDLSLNGFFSSKDTTINADQFGYDISVPFISGFLAQSQINLSWVVEDPKSRNLINGFVNDSTFSGFQINFYDTGKNLISSLPGSFAQTNYTVNSSDLFNTFGLVTGFQNVSNLNQFLIEVISKDLENKTSTGVALVNFGVPSVSISGYSLDTALSINLDYADSRIIESLDVFVTTGTSFDPDNENNNYLLYKKYISPSINQVFIEDLNQLGSNINLDNDVRIPYYTHLIPYNYFTSGIKVVSSGVKPGSFSILDLPEKIVGLTGYAYFDFNSVSKDLNLNSFVKWNSVLGSQDCSFHVLVEESGKNKTKYDYFLNNRSLENINGIAFGTGTGLSPTGTVFSNYGSSGIQWPDHTLYVDNFGSLPTGLYDQYSTGINYITEIRIPSGFTNNNEIFLCYGYTGDNSFNVL